MKQIPSGCLFYTWSCICFNATFSITTTLSFLHCLFSMSMSSLKVKVAQSSPTLCDPMDCIVHEILQARILEWVAFPSPGDLADPGIELGSPALQADSLPAKLLVSPLLPANGFISIISLDSLYLC